MLKLIAFLKKLPGVGNKTAERFAFTMLSWQHEQLKDMGTFISDVKEHLRYCEECGALIGIKEQCPLCTNANRDNAAICIVATAKDIFAIEDTREYKGLYHVLGGVLSPLDGNHVEHLTIPKLQERIEKLGVKEIILALDSTLEGDTTALYIKKIFKDKNINISRLAFGIPMGSALDFVDEGTLTRALAGRREF